MFTGPFTYSSCVSSNAARLVSLTKAITFYFVIQKFNWPPLDIDNIFKKMAFSSMKRNLIAFIKMDLLKKIFPS